MSFRNTFVTNFIYQASDETRDANPKVIEIFEKWCGSTLCSKVDERGYGYYSGWFKTLSGTVEEAQEDFRQIIPALEKATKLAFQLTVVLECGPTITFTIEPRPQTPLEVKE